MSPGQLTDMRSASVNNDCYAMSAIKVQLHKHVLHASQELHKHIVATLDKFDEVSSSSTFGWESEASFPKVSLSKSWNNAITVIVVFDQQRMCKLLQYQLRLFLLFLLAGTWRHHRVSSWCYTG